MQSAISRRQQPCILGSILSLCFSTVSGHGSHRANFTTVMTQVYNSYLKNNGLAVTSNSNTIGSLILVIYTKLVKHC